MEPVHYRFHLYFKPNGDAFWVAAHSAIGGNQQWNNHFYDPGKWLLLDWPWFVKMASSEMRSLLRKGVK